MTNSINATVRSGTSRQTHRVKGHRNRHTRQTSGVQPLTSSKTLHVLDFSARIPIQPSRALRAADSLNWDLLDAVVAGLLGDLCACVTADLIDFDDKEDTGRNDEEVEDGLDEVSPVPGDAVVRLCLCSCSILLLSTVVL